jgi:hypothetical protein
VDYRQEFDRKLTPFILQKLSDNVWPLEDSKLHEKIKNYIEMSTYFLSTLSSKKFIRSFSFNTSYHYRILTKNDRFVNKKCPKLLIDRERVKKLSNWHEILKEAEYTWGSLMTKVWAVEIVSNSVSRGIPGIDNLCFLPVLRKVKSNAVALKYCDGLIKRLKYEINLSKGKSDQAVRRKHLNNLSSREKHRRYLKTCKGKSYIKDCKKQYRLIHSDPVKYAFDLEFNAISHNFRVKL